MMHSGACSCGANKSPKEITVTLPTGNSYRPDIDLYEDGTVSLKIYGNKKTEFWKDFYNMYQTVGSWDQIPIIEANYQGVDYKLQFLWEKFVPGSGLYFFSQST